MKAHIGDDFSAHSRFLLLKERATVPRQNKKGYRLDEFSSSSQTIITRLDLIKKKTVCEPKPKQSHQDGLCVTHYSSFPLRVQHAAKGLLSEEEGVPKKGIHEFSAIAILKQDNS